MIQILAAASCAPISLLRFADSEFPRPSLPRPHPASSASARPASLLRHSRLRLQSPTSSTANPRTKILDFRGFDPSRISDT